MRFVGLVVVAAVLSVAAAPFADYPFLLAQAIVWPVLAVALALAWLGRS